MSDLEVLALPEWCYSFNVAAAAAVFGAAVWQRGARYFQDGHVINVTCQGDTLVTDVLGSGNNSYRVLITPTQDPGRLTAICTCPVGLNCKHAACTLLQLKFLQDAILDCIRQPGRLYGPEQLWTIPGLITSDGHAPTAENTKPGFRPIAIASSGATPEQKPQVAPWEQALAGITNTVEHQELDAQLAVVLTKDDWERNWTVSLHRSGKATPWHKTPLNWDSLLYRKPSLRLDEQQVNAVVRLRNAMPAGHDSSWGGGPNLQAFGPDLWPALNDCVAAGVQVLHNTETKMWQPVTVMGEDVSLEVHLTSHHEDLHMEVIIPQLSYNERMWDEDFVMLGTSGHGVAADLPDGLVLARFRELPNQAMMALCEQTPTTIPAEDTQRFIENYLPLLCQQVTVKSPDNAVTIHKPAEPVLLIAITSPSASVLHADVTYMYRRDELIPLAGIKSAERNRSAEAKLLQRLQDFLDQAQVPLETTGDDAWRAVMYGGEAILLRQRLKALAAQQPSWIVHDELPDMHASFDVNVSVDITDQQDLAEGRSQDLGLDGKVNERDLEGRAVKPVDWFNLSIEVTVAGHKIPIQQLIAAIGRGDDEIFLSSGVVFPTDHPDLEPLRQLCEMAAEFQHDALGSAVVPDELTRINPDQIGWFEQLQAAGIVGQQSAAWRQRIKTLTEQPHSDSSSRIEATLRPYQQEGSDWLIRLWTGGVGGVLADDMGLGKTLQMLTLIDHAVQHETYQQGNRVPFLVVAPASVASAWQREAEKFAPHLAVAVVGSTLKKAGVDLEQLRAKNDVVVTSYTVLRLDQKHYHQYQWNAVICDEAQFIKNPRSKTYAAVRKTPARSVFAITGTPVENSLMDMWSMLSLAAPGLFPDPERFTRSYRKPIEDHHNGHILADLKAKIRPLVLRRTKDAVATDLPPKQEQVVRIELSTKHRQAYEVLLNAERQKILGLLDDLGEHRVSVLAGLTRLRLASLNPHLVAETEAGAAGDISGQIALSKVSYLADTVAELAAEGHRVLVFSQFTSFLKTIRDRFTADNISWTYLDGSTRKRGERIKEFTEGDATAFLISLKAGGFGLTLTEADYVFVVDPWWNPAAEAQAIDRAHRIGQTKPVHVYRLVAADTIEEKVLELQQRKRDLYRAVVDDGTFESGSLSAADIEELLT